MDSSAFQAAAASCNHEDQGDDQVSKLRVMKQKSGMRLNDIIELLN
jgi:hypothetical protein